MWKCADGGVARWQSVPVVISSATQPAADGRPDAACTNGWPAISVAGLRAATR